MVLGSAIEKEYHLVPSLGLFVFLFLEHHGHVFNNMVPFLWAAVLALVAGLGLLAYQKINDKFSEKLWLKLDTTPYHAWLFTDALRM